MTKSPSLNDVRSYSRRRLLQTGGLIAAAGWVGVGGTASAAQVDFTQPVATTLGAVRGVNIPGLKRFRGIHYGARVDGPGRFMAPRKAAPWRGVRDAVLYGPACPQLSDAPMLLPPQGSLPPTENCLALNIYTPGLDGKARPVMVWQHFSGFMSGDASFSWTDGENLARDRDVVVVSLNHRINIFGYMYLGGLGGEAYADSGNVGMLDIVLALEWVRDNIGAFGGDPGNVTIFGESGGGMKVSTLMAMPAAKGLFHKAIVQSGSIVKTVTAEQGTETSKAVMAALDLGPDQVSALQEVSADQLLLAMKTVLDTNDPDNRRHRFAPVAAGPALPRHPFWPDAPDTSANVPLLVGTTAQETAVLLGAMRGDDSIYSLDEAGLRAGIKRVLHVDEGATDSLVTAYRAANPAATPSDIFIAVTTDADWRMPAITQAERRLEKKQAPTFMYLYAWKSPAVPRYRAGHGIENTFVFRNIDAATRVTGTGPERALLADRTSDAWVAFARTGNPSHPGLPSWPAYTLKRRETMVFDNECAVVSDPASAERLVQRALKRG